MTAEAMMLDWEGCGGFSSPRRRIAVRGVLHIRRARRAGSQDDGLIFADILWVQKTFKKGTSISLIELSALCSGCPIEDMVGQVNSALPGARAVAVKETVELKMQAMHYFHTFSLGISALLLIVAGMIIFFAMTASVKERVQEIGLFRAIGYRTGHIIQVLLTEAFIVSLLAGTVGTSGTISPASLRYLMSAYNPDVGVRSGSLPGARIVGHRRSARWLLSGGPKAGARSGRGVEDARQIEMNSSKFTFYRLQSE
jgi:ABC-type lipoprotein release transport system permease subunit